MMRAFAIALRLLVVAPGLTAAESAAASKETGQRITTEDGFWFGPGALWPSNRPFPRAEELGRPAGQRDVLVEGSDSDQFRFLHDPAIVVHQGELLAAWYNCPEQEIVGASLIRGRRSRDGGRSWSTLEVIAADRDHKGIFYVPVQLLSYGGTLYAFVGKMEGGHDLIRQCAVFVWDEDRRTWNERGEIADLFLPNCAPVRMADGNFILAGRVAAAAGSKPLIPAVAISEGDRLTARWKVVRLRAAALLPGQHPETTLWLKGRELTALVRNSLEPRPFMYVSHDFGRSWYEAPEHPFGAGTSKLYAGRLSTGQCYVLFNYPLPKMSRAVLALGITSPGGSTLAKLWKVRSPTSAGPKWSCYPCAVEHDGKLYIVYTMQHSGPRECGLSIIPVASLNVTSGSG
jgi:hypothetical protein